MIPIIFPANETAFNTRGYGSLPNTLSCTVTEELNGQFFLNLKYAKNGVNEEYLQPRNIIVCQSSYGVEREAFRISTVNRSMRNNITVTAYHLSYDLSGFPVLPHVSNSLASALTYLQSASGNFTITTDKTSPAQFTVDVPSSVRSWFGGKEGSLIDVYGGEWKFHFWNCQLLGSRGSDQGARASESVNISDYIKDANDGYYSHVMSYFAQDVNGVMTVVSGDSMQINETYTIQRTLIRDVTDQFDDVPTKAQVNALTTIYINSHRESLLSDSETVTIKPELFGLESVELGDTVRVAYNGKLEGIRVVKIEWNVLTDKYNIIELGKLKENIAETIKALSVGSGSSGSGSGGSSIVVDDALSTISPNPVQNQVITNAINNLPYALSASHEGSAVRSAGIPFATVDSTSTATAFTATVEGITSLYDGVCVWLKNGVVTSASGFTVNINDLGAKPVYTNLASATRDTTIFNVAYTMLFVYDSTRVSGGCWICYRGYDANTNTIGYQLRTNSMSLPASDTGYRYRLWLTSADGSQFVPINISTSTNATTARTLNTRPIDPFGEIVYNATNGTVSAGARPAVTTLWQQYVLAIGYSYVMTLTAWKPVYLKCTPQNDGSAVMETIVQALPTSADGKIYIFLGVAYSATNMELLYSHPVYYHDGTGIRAWTGATYVAEADLSDKLSALGIVPQQIYFDTTAHWNAQTSLESQENTVYVYTDYQTSEGENLAGIKIGDGNAYVVDLPFIDTLYKQHIENATIHITQAEREFWNNKNRAYMSLTDPETMILTIN